MNIKSLLRKVPAGVRGAIYWVLAVGAVVVIGGGVLFPEKMAELTEQAGYVVDNITALGVLAGSALALANKIKGNFDDIQEVIQDDNYSLNESDEYDLNGDPLDGDELE